MEEKKKHKVVIGIEVVLLCMIIAIIGTNAASSNPPSSGVSYSKNSQTTVEGALNDLYTKANYGNATAAQILKGKKALVGGKQVTGTMTDWTGTPQHIDATRLKDNQFQVAVASGYHGYSWAGNSYEYLTYAEVASKIGLTKEKLLKDQTVLGITGTGETSCPTPESQGYYKIKKFENVKVTVYNNYQTFDGTWKHFGYGEYDGGFYTNGTIFSINLNSDLGISPTVIEDYTVTFSCNVDYGIRIGRGYDENSTTKMYWYLDGNQLTLTKTDPITTMWPTTGGSTSSHAIESSIENYTLNFKFRTDRGSNTKGKTQSTYETKCKEFYLSGSIIYK